MSEMKHTAGPWRMSYGTWAIFDPTYKGFVAFVDSPDGSRLYVCAPDHVSVAEEGHIANARLIAAAPDLAIVAAVAFRLLTPEQCARLSPDEEAAFGRVEGIVR